MRKTASKALNILIAALALWAWASMTFQLDQHGSLSAGGFRNLRYFTVLSNLMQAGTSLAYALGGRPRRLKYASTVSVGLTFFVVLLFLGQLYGYPSMYSGPSFWFHLVVPVLAMADFLCLDREGTFTLRDSVLSMIPTLCYGLFYVGNLLINGVKGNDWYGFARGGPGSAAIVFMAILAGSWLIALALRLPRKARSRTGSHAGARVRNVVFDLVGVLMRFDTEGYYRDHAIGPADAELIHREVFRSLEWAMQDRGTIPEEDAVAAICARVPARLHPVVRDFVRRENRAILPVTGMDALLETLKEKGCRLYLLSNTSTAFHRFRAEIQALQSFDGVLISADCGLVKPDPAIFRLACRRFGIDPAETAFVDDTPINVETALHIGMRAFVFNGDVDALKLWLDHILA